MSNSPLFKRAFVRGLNAELIRQGVLVYPSKEAADHTADFIADQSGMPDPVSEGERLDIKTASALVDFLIQGAGEQCKAAGNQYSPQLTKTAQAEDPAQWAYGDAIALMEKSAAENDENTLANAAQYSDEAKRELEDRPPGDYERDYGAINAGNPGALVGEELEPTSPGNDESQKVPGTNSVVATSKTSALQQIVRRMAKRAENGDNTLAAAAQLSEDTARELRERPEGYANAGGAMGQSDFNIPASAQVGLEQEHPDAYGPGGTNSVTDAVGGEKAAFHHLFSTTAAQVVPYLPERMADEHKVAHVRQVMGLSTPERAQYLGHLYQKLGADAASARSVHDHFMKRAADEDGKKKDSDDSEDEEGEDSNVALPAFMRDDKKEASLSNIRKRLHALHA